MRHHRNAALSFEMRCRLVERCQSRPIAHVAAEAGVSRQCLSGWVKRYRQFGTDGLVDLSSRPVGLRTRPRTRSWHASWRCAGNASGPPARSPSS